MSRFARVRPPSVTGSRSCTCILDHDKRVTSWRSAGHGVFHAEEGAMARLLAEAEYTFETDFALAGARQGDAESGDTMTYAASGPGAVALQCGTKYASVHLRLERWD